MANKVSYLPEGYRSVTPYLVLESCTAALEFYKTAFGAEELMRMPAPGGKIGHAEVRIGDSVVMLADSTPEHPPTSTLLMIYTPDCDAMFKRAVDGGATVLQPLEDKFYGDRSGSVRDPFGQRWSLATHVEDVTPEEMERRMRAMGEG